MITKHCGLVDLLSEEDNVMADRGFDVQDILSAARVTLNIPRHGQHLAANLP